MSQIGYLRFASSHFFKARLSVKPLIWKWFLIIMQIKRIYTTKVSHLASFWKWDFLEIGNGLLLLGSLLGTHRSAIGLISYPDLPRVKQSEIWVRDYHWTSFSLSLVTVPEVIATKKKKQKQKTTTTTTTTKTLVPLKWIKAWVISYFPVKMKNVVWEMSVLAVPRPPSW